MKVLLVGEGAREHALFNAFRESSKLTQLWVAPGNAGTHGYNVDLDIKNHAQVCDWAKTNEIDLVVVGPEEPLVAGLVDDLNNVGIKCFGPTQAAAKIEGSKSFARKFAEAHSIPSPRFAVFDDSQKAIDWIDSLDFEVVIKADGLASGTGVYLPASREETLEVLHALIDDAILGEAGKTVVVEERLKGEEVSLFGISDGNCVVSLAVAQDHKRIADGDKGPNTGGMGAFSPVPGIDYIRLEELSQTFLEPAIQGLKENGTPFVGMLFAGLMMCADGTRLIEYNCRFGDPEAQAMIARLEVDLLELCDAAVNGKLAAAPIVMSHDSAMTVVMALPGYPLNENRNAQLPPLELFKTSKDDHVKVHLGALQRNDEQLPANKSVTATGGRVLSITGRGSSLKAAAEAAYTWVEKIRQVSNLHARSDIGWRHLKTDAN